MPIDFREIEELRRSFNDLLSKFDKFIEEIRAEKERIEKQFLAKLNELKFFNFSLEELKNFIEEPYVLIPRRKDEYYVIVPKFIPMQIGWLHSRTKSYNIFIINKYIQWLYDLPEEIKSKIKFPTPLPLKVENGYLLTGKDLQETAWRKYRQYLTRREGEDKIRIKRGYEFRLIAKLIEDGILPFIPHPVDKNDLRYWNKIKLRSYQQKAWQKFLKTGAIGIYWVFGAGKSYFGIYCLARIKGRKLVVVPTLTLKEQWIKRINEHIPKYRHEIDIITYASAHKVMKNQYTLTIYDECHRLPANTYIKLATLKTKYRIGLSVSGDTVIPIRDSNGIYLVKIEDFVSNIIGDKVGEGVPKRYSETLGVTSDGKVVWTPIYRVFRHKLSDKKLLEVRLSNGRTIKVTEDHSLLVWDTDNLRILPKKCGELKIGDYLIVPKVLPIENTIKTFSVLDFFNPSDNVYVKLKHLPENYAVVYKLKIGSHKDRYNWKRRLSLPLKIALLLKVPTELIDYLYVHHRKCGIKPQIPAEDLAFLIGVFLGDGCIDSNRVFFSLSNMDEVKVVEEKIKKTFSISPKIRKEKNQYRVYIQSGIVSLLFRRLGLHNGSKQKEIPSTILSYKNLYKPLIYGLILSDGHISNIKNRTCVFISTSSYKLARQIEFILTALNKIAGTFKRVAKHPSHPDRLCATNELVRFNVRGEKRLKYIPFEGKLRNVYLNLEKRTKKGKKYIIETSLKKRRRLNFNELLTILKRGQLNNKLWLLENEIAFVKVNKITEVKGEKYVYDLSTGTENFLGNNIFCHNSGSPFREDKRENYIFALTGFPVGLDWSELIELGVVAVPKFKLYIVKNNREKIERLEELLRIPVKTIIFCDSIDMGKKLSRKFGIPFVYGATKDRLETIKKHNQVIVSRVGDEGVSLPEIERVIEVSFLYGSRRQESQRFGRLMHSNIDEEPEHNIIMTEEEFQKYQKRLLAIYERGFRIQIIR